MRARFLRFVLVCVIALVVAGRAAARAGEYRYPKLAPVLSLSLPEGWSVREQDGPAQLLLCTPPDDPTYTISVLSLPTVGGKEDLQEVLSRITKAGASGAGLTDIAVSAATEGPIGKSARRFTRVTASGNHDGEASAYTYYAFTLPGMGKSYAVGVAGLSAMIDAHQAEFAAVAESIAPVH